MSSPLSKQGFKPCEVSCQYPLQDLYCGVQGHLRVRRNFLFFVFLFEQENTGSPFSQSRVAFNARKLIANQRSDQTGPQNHDHERVELNLV